MLKLDLRIIFTKKCGKSFNAQISVNTILYVARGPDTKLDLSKIRTFKHLFSTLQCNPSNPVCTTKDFLLNNSAQKQVF